MMQIAEMQDVQEAEKRVMDEMEELAMDAKTKIEALEKRITELENRVITGQ